MPFQISILPPSAALAEHVLFYVARRRSGPAAPAPASWITHFPANMYSGLTIVHSGYLADARTAGRTPGLALSGAMSRTVAREYFQAPETTVVVFKPGRLTDFCRLPASDLTDHWADAGTVLSLAEHMDLGERMAAQPTLARQIMVLEQVLQRRFARRSSTQAQALAQVVKSLVWRLPHMKVQSLADELGWGLRRLERRCQDTFGISPRTLIRLARLQLALVQLQRGDGLAGSLAALAQAAGFADHAHLSREVKALAGLPPSRLAEVLRSPGNSAWAFSVPQDSLAPLAA